MKTKLMFILAIILVSLSISSVCASDVDNQTIQSIDQITSAAGDVIVDDVKLSNVNNIGSFRDMQSLINNNDVINLTKDFTATESDGIVEISGSKIINGNGHVLNGNGKTAIFKITGGDVVLNDIILVNGKSSDGGAVYVSNANSLKFNKIIFDSNHATDDGGAVYIDKGKSISFVNCDFLKNTASDYGGAIYTSEYLNIINCSFDSNKINAYINAYAAIRGYGGAIYAKNNLNINGSEFTNSYAMDDGGAIYTTKSLNVTDSFFDSNKVWANGGAIYAKGVASVTSSTFMSNKAIVNEIHPKNNNNYGGAIYGGDNVNVVDSLFKFNSAYVDGGAIYSKKNVAVKKSIFDSNVASGDSCAQCCGGAISSDHDVKVDNSTFINNHAEDYGGAIYADTVTWVDGLSYFIGNYAEDNQGGAIYTNKFTTDVKYGIFIGNQAKDDDGGAIYINKENHITFSSCTFKDNYADDEGGAIYLDSSSSVLTLADFNSFINNGAGDEGQAVFNKGTYGEVRNNWWGIALPDFSKDLLVEWKAIWFNVMHKDLNPLGCQIELISTGDLGKIQ